jgi:hypothetical protein
LICEEILIADASVDYTQDLSAAAIVRIHYHRQPGSHEGGPVGPSDSRVLDTLNISVNVHLSGRVL